jgi:hypothetical protein
MRFALAVVVELGTVVGSTVVDDVVSTVVVDVVDTAVDEVVGAEGADDDPPVDVVTAALDVVCCESEQPTATIDRALNPIHAERNPTRADCSVVALDANATASADPRLFGNPPCSAVTLHFQNVVFGGVALYVIATGNAPTIDSTIGRTDSSSTTSRLRRLFC